MVKPTKLRSKPARTTERSPPRFNRQIFIAKVSHIREHWFPPKTLPRSPGNEREWLDACKGDKTKPGGNFEFEGLVTETLLLGNVASCTGERLHWDRVNLKVSSVAGQKFVQPERRKGWEL